MLSIIIAFASLALLAAANTSTVTVTQTVTAQGSSPTCSQCNTGPIQCCDSVEPASSSAASRELALLGLVVANPATPIGLTCTPITVLGIGGDNCDATPVCCNNNNFNGVVAIGCVPIIINL